MSRQQLRTTLSATVLGLSLISRAAGAEAPPEGSALYGPWMGQGAYGRPRPLAHRPRPAPRLPEPEYGRSTGEFVGEIAGALGWCADSPLSCSGQSPLSAGLGGSLSLLWRPASYFSWGGRLGVRRMLVPHGDTLDPGGTTTHSAALVLLGRVYFATQGVAEPYADLGAGVARVESVRPRPEQELASDSSTRFTLEVGGGLDFFISSRARFGPALTFLHVAGEEASVCSAELGELCAEPIGRRWRLRSMVTLGARLSLLFGEAL